MQGLLKRQVVFVPGETLMRDVVAQMRDQNISSVLVLNPEQEVVGLITERDIVQKFTLLEVDDKLNAKANAVMSRPIEMARLTHLEEDVRYLFSQKHFRHFPVTTSGTRAVDIIGMMTVTDLAGAWLRTAKGEEVAKYVQPLVIVSRDAIQRGNYTQLFRALQFEPIEDDDTAGLVSRAIAERIPVVIDLDGMGVDAARRYLASLREHRSCVLVLSSVPQLVAPLRSLMANPQRTVALKPLDVAQILRFLSQVRVKAARIPA